MIHHLMRPLEWDRQKGGYRPPSRALCLPSLHSRLWQHARRKTGRARACYTQTHTSRLQTRQAGAIRPYDAESRVQLPGGRHHRGAEGAAVFKMPHRVGAGGGVLGLIGPRSAAWLLVPSRAIRPFRASPAPLSPRRRACPDRPIRPYPLVVQSRACRRVRRPAAAPRTLVMSGRGARRNREAVRPLRISALRRISA